MRSAADQSSPPPDGPKSSEGEASLTSSVKAGGTSPSASASEAKAQAMCRQQIQEYEDVCHALQLAAGEERAECFMAATFKAQGCKRHGGLRVN